MVEQQPKEELGPYQLWRQDDHGNRFLIKSFENATDAEMERKMFEDHGHKQMYEVVPVNLPTTEENTPNLPE